jgi:glutamate dehydrogenase (NAD(P)+)
METSSYNPFHVAQSQFDKVAAILELYEGVRELLRQPVREYQFTMA